MFSDVYTLLIDPFGKGVLAGRVLTAVLPCLPVSVRDAQILTSCGAVGNIYQFCQGSCKKVLVQFASFQLPRDL